MPEAHTRVTLWGIEVFLAVAEEGTISKSDLDLFSWCETAEEAWACIADFYEIKG